MHLRFNHGFALFFGLPQNQQHTCSACPPPPPACAMHIDPLVHGVAQGISYTCILLVKRDCLIVHEETKENESKKPGCMKKKKLTETITMYSDLASALMLHLNIKAISGSQTMYFCTYVVVSSYMHTYANSTSGS